MASASGAWRSRSALEETAFSQVRSDPRVVGAWIEHPGQSALSYPPETPMPTVALRALPLAALEHCEAATTDMVRAGTTTPVLLVALDHDGLRTVLAIARDRPD